MYRNYQIAQNFYFRMAYEIWLPWFILFSTFLVDSETLKQIAFIRGV